MYVISNEAWREAIKLLTAYRASAHDRGNLREVNYRRRAALLVRKLKKSQKLKL